MKLIYYLICLSVICISCKNKIDKSADSNRNILINVGSKIFNMGEYDYPTSGYIRYFTEGDSCFFAQHNRRTNVINVYNYQSGDKIKEIHLPVSLPSNDVYVHNQDTILTCTKSNPAHVFMFLPQTGDVIDILVNIKEESGCVQQFPHFFPDGLTLLNEKFYVTCSRLGEYPDKMKKSTDRPPLLELDFNQKKYQFLSGYPELYVHNNMATLHYWEPLLTSNPLRNELIVAFKASPEIKVISGVDFSEKGINIKSLFADSIPLPFTLKGRDYFSDEDSYYNFAQNSHYDRIMYDPWRRIYYRLFGIGLNDNSLKKDILLQYKKQFSVMILDENLNKLDEAMLEKGYDNFYCFVTPKGLHILRKSKNEDKAVYDIFAYKPQI